VVVGRDCESDTKKAGVEDAEDRAQWKAKKRKGVGFENNTFRFFRTGTIYHELIFIVENITINKT